MKRKLLKQCELYKKCLNLNTFKGLCLLLSGRGRRPPMICSTFRFESLYEEKTLLQRSPVIGCFSELGENSPPDVVLQRLLVDDCNKKPTFSSPAQASVRSPAHFLCHPPPLFSIAFSQSSFSRLMAFFLRVQSSMALFLLHRKFVRL